MGPAGPGLKSGGALLPRLAANASRGKPDPEQEVGG